MFALFWEYNIDLGGTYLKVPTVFCDKKNKIANDAGVSSYGRGLTSTMYKFFDKKQEIMK